MKPRYAEIFKTLDGNVHETSSRECPTSPEYIQPGHRILFKLYRSCIDRILSLTGLANDITIYHICFRENVHRDTTLLFTSVNHWSAAVASELAHALRDPPVPSSIFSRDK